jgi:hypothetical protein
MVDRLKNSLAELEPPTCMRCGIEMRWFMSKLERQEPVTTIVHSLVCPGCEGAADTETEFKPVRVLRDKLAAPRTGAQAA